MKKLRKHTTFMMLICLTLGLSLPAWSESEAWDLANENEDTFRFSTLFTAQNVRDHLQNNEGLDAAVEWCKQHGVTHVYLETFRGGYLVPWGIMQKAKERFESENFQVSGCITTVGIGKESVDGWIFPCFTEKGGLENLKHIFEYTAMQFDNIMVDDFFATGCQCEECIAAKGDKSWAEFRTDLMVDVSKEYVINPSKGVNPDATIIIKYPQWYSNFQNRGYDVDRQTKLFDQIWVGTETRDPDNEEWGRHPQYMAYFIMRWLGEVGDEKCGGGWFDPYGTSPETYVEQARQTILAGADEALLFCYGSLLNEEGRANTKAFQQEIPELFKLAQLVNEKAIYGVHAPKPPNSESSDDQYFYDFIGMLGVPLVPAEEFTTHTKSALLGHQVLADPNALDKINQFKDDAKPVLLTDTLVNKLPEDVKNNLGSLMMIKVPQDKWDWMNLDEETINEHRNKLLKPFGVQLSAPSRVSLYLYEDGLYGVENFNNQPVEVILQVDGIEGVEKILTVKKENTVKSSFENGVITLNIPERTLVMLKSK